LDEKDQEGAPVETPEVAVDDAVPGGNDEQVVEADTEVDREGDDQDSASAEAAEAEAEADAPAGEDAGTEAPAE
jgi:hypothetical protein